MEPPLDLADYGWLIGDPLVRQQPQVVPVVTLSLGQTVGGIVQDAAFLVALLGERESDATVHAEGWRFETAERAAEPPDGQPPTPPAHPYCHAQAIHGWTRENQCLLHPPHRQDESCDGIDRGAGEAVDGERLRQKRATLVSHPAFPLRVSTLTGLAAAVLATLYGANHAATLIENDQILPRLEGPVRDDLDALHMFDLGPRRQK